jgi:DNA polymerase-3 subunit delta'
MNVVEDMGWLAPAWQRLKAYIDTGRVPQALLIVGRQGVGKTVLAEAFSQRLLCRAELEYACGECPSCRLYAAKTHPDFLRIQPDEPSKVIPIDAIRGLIATLSLKPQYSGRRVALITPAQQMNPAAANSLLKTLEEPDEHTSLILLTDAPEALAATILSRCQRLDIPTPDHSLALDWLGRQGQAERAEVLLALAKGSPLKALAGANDGLIEKRGEFFSGLRELSRGGEPTIMADKWAKFSCETLTDWLVSWTMDLIRLHAAPGNRAIDNADLRESLQATAQTLNLQQLFSFLDRLQRARKMLASQVNRPLLVEELLIFWQQIASSTSTRKVIP